MATLSRQVGSASHTGLARRSGHEAAGCSIPFDRAESVHGPPIGSNALPCGTRLRSRTSSSGSVCISEVVLARGSAPSIPKDARAPLRCACSPSVRAVSGRARWILARRLRSDGGTHRSLPRQRRRKSEDRGRIPALGAVESFLGALGPPPTQNPPGVRGSPRAGGPSPRRRRLSPRSAAAAVHSTRQHRQAST